MSIDEYRDDDVETFQLRPMEAKCEYCEAQMFWEEGVGADGHFRMCCANGKLKHFWQGCQECPECPEPLLGLLTGRGRRARDFRDKIRCYNSALSFLSFGAKIEFPPGTGTRGPPVCVLHGALYHYSYALEATAEQMPKFAQLYMYDHAEAQHRRSNYWADLDPEILEELAAMMEEVSPFINRRLTP